MTNFSINFIFPWLLLLIVPFAVVTFITYFRHPKKHRRNRNRIVSIVLHLIVVVMATLVLSGLTFSYDKPNEENEIILLVDMSHSSVDQEEEKIDFVKQAVEESGSMFKVGIVLFGRDQIEAARLSYDHERVVEDFEDTIDGGDLPDDSATNIAGAVNFTKELFMRPKTAKIVIISDGIETDGNAIAAIKNASAEGIKVDTVYFPNGNEKNPEVMISGVERPDYNVGLGEEFKLKVNLKSSVSGDGKITFKDVFSGDEETTQIPVTFEKGEQTVEISHKFLLPGLHELTFDLETASTNDTEMRNNTYVSYMYLEEFTEVLVLERNAGEGKDITNLLRVNNVNVTCVNVYDDPENVPKTLEALRAYDEVILVNISNADMTNEFMPIGFDKILKEYVETVGGGLLTVGGSDGSGNANMYNSADLKNTVYQQLLPVNAINYTPPVGVMFIIDKSGSMSSDVSLGDETISKLEAAKRGAKASLLTLEARDWGGVMSLDDSVDTEINLTPMTKEYELRTAIDAIELGGGTAFSWAIKKASEALTACKMVQKRHIILVTDGMPSDDFDTYSALVKEKYEKEGITLSVVGIGVEGEARSAMEKLVSDEYGHGRFYGIDSSNIAELGAKMREDLNVPEITSYEPGEYKVEVNVTNSISYGVNFDNLPMLGGYYGTQAKDGANVILYAPYETPLYAQWKYGEGSVGSFMCDFGASSWSKDFASSLDGQLMFLKMVQALFPTRSIRDTGISASIREDNYTTNVSIYTKLGEGETVKVSVDGPFDFPIDPLFPSAEDGFSRVSFEIDAPGVYEIYVSKINASGVEVEGVHFKAYRSFAFSKEYDTFVDADEHDAFLSTMASSGKGNLITDTVDEQTGTPISLTDQIYKIYDEFEKYINVVIDPRAVLLIIALVLFLLDIAVRKFKFKWPHEIVKEVKIKKQLKNENK